MVQLDVKTDVEFDFEEFVQKELLPEIEKGGTSVNTFGLASSFGKGSDPKRRTVVCRHWLVGLCQKVLRCVWVANIPCKIVYVNIVVQITVLNVFVFLSGK